MIIGIMRPRKIVRILKKCEIAQIFDLMNSKYVTLEQALAYLHVYKTQDWFSTKVSLEAKTVYVQLQKNWVIGITFKKQKDFSRYFKFNGKTYGGE
jgi:hypothetical protein